MKGHYKSLDVRDRSSYVSKYSFNLVDETTILCYSVGNDGSVRTNAHKFGVGFVTNIKDEKGKFKRNLFITPLAQEYWKNNFPNYNLGLIQSAINELKLNKSKVEVEEIKKILEKY